MEKKGSGKEGCKKSKDSSSEEDEPVRKKNKGNGKKSKDSNSEEDELV